LQRPTRDRLRSGDIILIVCEGGKTEPDYFNGLRRRWRLGAHVEVVGDASGSAPINVVDYALERKSQAEKGAGVPYDAVWCVFDHDRHKTLDRALSKAKSNGLLVALSVPCFEFWYLLHFAYTTRAFGKCGEVVKELCRHIRGYRKGKVELDMLWPNLPAAVANAQRVREDNKKTGAASPMTDVDLLIEKLIEMTGKSIDDLIA